MPRARRPFRLGSHFSNIETRWLGSVDGGDAYEYKGLTPDEVVDLVWESPGQDGYDYRAVTVRRRR
jgi:hypothetical protein